MAANSGLTFKGTSGQKLINWNFDPLDEGIWPKTTTAHGVAMISAHKAISAWKALFDLRNMTLAQFLRVYRFQHE